MVSASRRSTLTVWGTPRFGLPQQARMSGSARYILDAPFRCSFQQHAQPAVKAISQRSSTALASLLAVMSATRAPGRVFLRRFNPKRPDNLRLNALA